MLLWLLCFLTLTTLLSYFDYFALFDIVFFVLIWFRLLLVYFLWFVLLLLQGDWLETCLVGLMAGWLSGWLVCWFNRLVGFWLAGWMVVWLTDCHAMSCFALSWVVVFCVVVSCFICCTMQLPCRVASYRVVWFHVGRWHDLTYNVVVVFWRAVCVLPCFYSVDMPAGCYRDLPCDPVVSPCFCVPCSCRAVLCRVVRWYGVYCCVLPCRGPGSVAGDVPLVWRQWGWFKNCLCACVFDYGFWRYRTVMINA